MVNNQKQPTIYWINAFEDDNKVIAGEKGAIETIVEVLNKHIDNVDACKNACKALWNITTNNSK